MDITYGNIADSLSFYSPSIRNINKEQHNQTSHFSSWKNDRQASVRRLTAHTTINQKQLYEKHSPKKA